MRTLMSGIMLLMRTPFMNLVFCVLFVAFSSQAESSKSVPPPEKESESTPQSQTFDAAKEQMLSGHRDEALTILREIYLAKKNDPRSSSRVAQALSMMDSFSSQFLNQESETLYFQAIQFISTRKWQDAKEKLDQASAKEGNHVLLLIRLAEVEKELKLKENAEEHLKIALKQNPFSKEAKIMQATLKGSAGEERETLRMLDGYKNYVMDTPVLLNFYVSMLKKLGRTVEIQNIQKRTLSSEKGSLIYWIGFFQNGTLAPEEQKLGKAALEKCSHEVEHCLESIDQELKRTQYLWMPPDDPLTSVRELLKNLSGRTAR